MPSGACVNGECVRKGGNVPTVGKVTGGTVN